MKEKVEKSNSFGSGYFLGIGSQKRKKVLHIPLASALENSCRCGGR